jgi:hypothetical protein
MNVNFLSATSNLGSIPANPTTQRLSAPQTQDLSFTTPLRDNSASNNKIPNSFYQELATFTPTEREKIISCLEQLSELRLNRFFSIFKEYKAEYIRSGQHSHANSSFTLTPHIIEDIVTNVNQGVVKLSECQFSEFEPNLAHIAFKRSKKTLVNRIYKFMHFPFAREIVCYSKQKRALAVLGERILDFDSVKQEIAYNWVESLNDDQVLELANAIYKLNLKINIPFIPNSEAHHAKKQYCENYDNFEITFAELRSLLLREVNLRKAPALVQAITHRKKFLHAAAFTFGYHIDNVWVERKLWLNSPIIEDARLVLNKLSSYANTDQQGIYTWLDNHKNSQLAKFFAYVHDYKTQLRQRSMADRYHRVSIYDKLSASGFWLLIEGFLAQQLNLGFELVNVNTKRHPTLPPTIVEATGSDFPHMQTQPQMEATTYKKLHPNPPTDQATVAQQVNISANHPPNTIFQFKSRIDLIKSNADLANYLKHKLLNISLKFISIENVTSPIHYYAALAKLSSRDSVLKPLGMIAYLNPEELVITQENNYYYAVPYDIEFADKGYHTLLAWLSQSKLLTPNQAQRIKTCSIEPEQTSRANSIITSSITSWLLDMLLQEKSQVQSLIINNNASGYPANETIILAAKLLDAKLMVAIASFHPKITVKLDLAMLTQKCKIPVEVVQFTDSQVITVPRSCRNYLSLQLAITMIKCNQFLNATMLFKQLQTKYQQHPTVATTIGNASPPGLALSLPARIAELYFAHNYCAYHKEVQKILRPLCIGNDHERLSFQHNLINDFFLRVQYSKLNFLSETLKFAQPEPTG